MYVYEIVPACFMNGLMSVFMNNWCKNHSRLTKITARKQDISPLP